MKRLPLLFFVLAVLAVSSCKVPVEPSPEAPAAPIPEDAVQPAPAVPSETPPQEAAEEPIRKPEIVYPFLGSENAPLTVTEYADFSERISSNAAISQVASIRRDYVVSNKARLVFKPYPLSGSDEAKSASQAAWCMWEQGSVQFWAYQSTLFTFYTHLDDASLKNYASRIPNSDKAAFVDCTDSGKYAAVVASTLEEGRRLGFAEVPVFVIGGKNFSGDVSYKKLKAAIEDELASKGGDAITGNVVFSQQALYGIPKAVLGFFFGRFK